MQQALDDLAGSSTFSQEYWVSLNGSDSNTGDIHSPWATITHANTQMTCGTSLVRPRLHLVGGGQWFENVSNPCAYAIYDGTGFNNVGLFGTWNFTGAAAGKYIFQNLQWNLAQSWTLGANVIILFNNVQSGNFGFTLTGTGAGAFLQVYFSYLGTAVIATDVSVWERASNFIGGLYCTASSFNIECRSQGGAIGSGMNITNTNGKSVAHSFSHQQSGNVFLSGTASGSWTVTALGQSVTLLNSAAAPTLSTPATALGYTPTTSVDWFSQPNNVGSALDNIATWQASSTNQLWMATGVLAATGSPLMLTGSAGTTGTVYGILIWPKVSATTSTGTFYTGSSNPSAITAASVGIWGSTGTLLAQTNDCSAGVSSSHRQVVCTFSSPFSLVANTAYYLGVVTVGSGVSYTGISLTPTILSSRTSSISGTALAGTATGYTSGTLPSLTLGGTGVLPLIELS